MTKSERRCGRCLYPVPPTTFIHDCGHLPFDQYVSRLENELERLEKWMSEHTTHPGGKQVVDAAIEVMGNILVGIPACNYCTASGHFAEACPTYISKGVKREQLLP